MAVIVFISHLTLLISELETTLKVKNALLEEQLQESDKVRKQEAQDHRRTGTFVLGGAAIFLPEKITQYPNV